MMSSDYVLCTYMYIPQVSEIVGKKLKVLYFTSKAAPLISLVAPLCFRKKIFGENLDFFVNFEIFGNHGKLPVMISKAGGTLCFFTVATFHTSYKLSRRKPITRFQGYWNSVV